MHADRMRASSSGLVTEQPINARPVRRAATIAAVTAAILPIAAPPVAAASPGPSPIDTGSLSLVNLRAIVAARATNAVHADRSTRKLYPPPPRHVRGSAVAVAVMPPAPPAPVVPVAPVKTYAARHAAPTPKKTVHNGYGNGGGHYVVAPAYSGSRAQIIVSFVLSKVGDSYVHGATGPSVWDCSGLSRAAAALVGVSLPHNADAQRAYVRRISRAELQPGDLVFYPSHVAVYIGNGMQVAAANVREGVVRQAVYGTPSMYGRL